VRGLFNLYNRSNKWGDGITKILILKGCPDFFPRELPRLPPDSEVEVSIDVIPRTISIGVDAFTNESHKTKSFDDID